MLFDLNNMGKPLKNWIPFVSLIIRTYHSSDTLIRTLESLASIEYDPKSLEMLIVCDFNDNESQTAIKGFLEMNPNLFSNIRVLYIEENIATKAWNKGINESKGEIQLVLPDDVKVHPLTLEHALNIFSEDSKVAAVTFPCVPEGINKISMKYKLNHMKYLGIKTTISSALLVTAYRKDVLTKIGFFREDMGLPLSIHEDWELGSRMRKNGYTMIVDGTITQVHLEGRDVDSKNKKGTVLEGENFSLFPGYIKKYIRQYIKANWWSMIQVLKVSPTTQLLEYLFYFTNPMILIALFIKGWFYFVTYTLSLGSVIVLHNWYKGYYRVFSRLQRIAFPILMFLIRSLRTYLTLIGFIVNKIKA